jgi:ABC-type transport system substrate-binding protein
MQKLIVGSIVCLLAILGWGARTVGAQDRAPRGELRIVDKRPFFGWSIVQSVVEHLGEIDRTGSLVPRLATSWRWLDERTLEMSLRPGVSFHNGEVFDAEIVKHNWDEHVRVRANYGEDLIWWTFPPTSRLEVLDPHTIRLVLPEPDAAALVKLSYMPITNRQFYRDMLASRDYWDTLFRAGPWGTGPYKWVEGFATALSQSPQAVLEANLGYWDRARFPRLQRIVFNTTLPRDEALELVKTREGRVDLVADLRTLDTLRVAQSPFARVVKERGGLRNVFGLLNMRKPGSPWRDIRLRQAVNYAINRDDLIRYATKGNGVIIPALLPTRAFGYDAALAPYPFDPTKARHLLRDAGYPNGLSITLIAPEELKVQTTVVSHMLEQAGFRVHQQLLDDVALYRRINLYELSADTRAHQTFPSPWPEVSWDIALDTTGLTVSLAASFPTPVYRLYALGGEWDWVIEEPTLRHLYEQVTHSRDQEQQQALIHQMERHTRDQAYFLFLYNLIQLYAVNKAVEFVPHPSGLFTLTEVSITDQHWSVRKP